MTAQKISELAYKEITNFKDKKVKITDGYSFSQFKTVNRIYLYLNDQFVTRKDDAIFWNLSTPRIPHFSKNLDLDTKDIQPIGEGEVSFYQTWALRIKFRKWLNDRNFGIDMDDMIQYTSSYGSSIWKIIDSEDGKDVDIELEDLRKIFFDPTVETVRDSDWISKVHYLTKSDLKDKEGAWDNVERALKYGKKASNFGGSNDKAFNSFDKNYSDLKYYEVIERWGYVDEDGDMVYKHVIFTGKGEHEVILYEEEIEKDDLPFYDFHLHDYQGRWMRRGVVERLFKLQERANRIVNENAEASTIASMLLMRTTDPETNGNVLTAAQSGQIIQSGDLQQIPLDNRAFGTLLNELQSIEAKADKLVMTPEIVSGDPLPSGTPFRSAAIMSNAAKSAFKQSRDRIGIVLAEVLDTVIMPSVARSFKKEDIVEIADDQQDIDQFNKAYSLNVLMRAEKDIIMQGEFITPQLRQLLFESITASIQRGDRKIKIDKSFFNFKYKITFDITGENRDKQQMNDAMFNALQFVQSNPEILKNSLFKQYLENNGISYWKLEPPQPANLGVGVPQPQPQGQPQQQGAAPKEPIGRGGEDALMSQVDSQ